MHDFWDGVERFWGSKIVGFALPVIGLGLVIWTTFTSQSPGISIGLLAGAAGIMSLRVDKMHPAEKSAWVIILVAFTILEVAAIRRADRENKDARDKQNQAFSDIAEGLKTSIKTSKAQYESTIGQVNGVLNTTQGIGDLAKESLEDITGGNTFAYVKPQNLPGTTRMFLTVFTVGRHNLTGVTVFAAKILGEACPVGDDIRNNHCYVHTDGGLGVPIEVGMLIGNSRRTMNGMERVFVNPDYTGKYIVEIYAQNGVTDEYIWFRPAKDGKGASYRMVAWWSHSLGNRDAKKVLSIPWTEPLPAQQFDLPKPQ